MFAGARRREEERRGARCGRGLERGQTRSPRWGPVNASASVPGRNFPRISSSKRKPNAWCTLAPFCLTRGVCTDALVASGVDIDNQSLIISHQTAEVRLDLALDRPKSNPMRVYSISRVGLSVESIEGAVSLEFSYLQRGLSGGMIRAPVLRSNSGNASQPSSHLDPYTCRFVPSRNV